MFVQIIRQPEFQLPEGILTMSQQDSAVEASNTATPPPRRRRRGKWLILLLLAGGIATWYSIQRDDGAQVQDRPLIAVVERGDIENTLSSAGTLKPSIYVDVGAQVSGQLEKLYVDVGDTVETGQLLAEIDARTQESRVDASRSALEALEAQIISRQASLELARANAQRQERLMAANATSQQDYDTATANLANAEASFTQLQKQIAQSRSSLSSEETQLEYTRIYAPIAGTVVSIEMNEGRTLNANQQAPTILRIADLSIMTVEAAISEADIGSLQAGMDIYFTTLSGGTRRWYGELRQILPTPVIENNVVLYTGLFDVDNNDGSLLPEMTAQVFFITSAARDVLTVPVGALIFADNDRADGTAPAPAIRAMPGAEPTDTSMRAVPTHWSPKDEKAHEPRRNASVEVIAADGSRQRRDVIIGITSRISAEIISGLQAGEQVVAGIIQNGAAGPQQGQFGPPRGMGGFR